MLHLYIYGGLTLINRVGKKENVKKLHVYLVYTYILQVSFLSQRVAILVGGISRFLLISYLFSVSPNVHI